ncbi:MAG: ABC-F family ATP-binding cassette domain-containing protein [Firmicutes bacterium]|nr:ABC-F family ATP-binding cassette domain-containing protein [Bacillota bacterium]
MLLQLKDIQKSIGIEEILANVSFIIEEKEKVALVGINGAGKTSVFRLLTGEWTADEGVITKNANLRLGYLPQMTNEEINAAMNANPNEAVLTLYESLDKVFDPLKKMEEEMRELETKMAFLTGSELEAALKRHDKLANRFEEMDGYEATSRLKGVLRGLGFPESQWQQPFGKLSGGERTRALLGKLLLERPDLLLLDEPTNHLDIDSVAWLEEYLRGFPGAVVIISHDRYFMDRVVTKVIEIENKKSVVYYGNYSYFVKKKADDREQARKRYTENQKMIKHHEEVIKTLRSFKTEAKLILAKSREKMLEKMERVEKPADDPSTMRLRLTPRLNSGNDVLTAEGLTMGFGGKTLFKDLSFEVKKGDKTALIGPNGVGKTTLIKLLVGQYAPWAGHIREGVNVRIGYYDQNTALSEEKTILQELADTYPRMGQTEIRTTLGAFMFIGDDVFKPIAALSGGERGRVQLAKIMLAGANFLVLDEPTNHLDLFSKEILEDALREFKGTLLYISHDRYFINNTATQILDLTPTGLVSYSGNYDYYVEKKAILIQEGFLIGLQEAARPVASSKEEYLRKKEQDAAERRKKSRIEKLETEITKVEAEIAQCDDKLADEEIGSNAEMVQEIFARKTELEKHLAGLYEEWGEASE